MALRRSTVLRLSIVVLAAILSVNVYRYGEMAILSRRMVNVSPSNRLGPEVFESLSLTERQCQAVFPELNTEIDLSFNRGKFVLEKRPDDFMGLVEVKIVDGKLYVISAERRPSREMLWERTAVLHQLHRAILTSPSPLPNTALTLSIIDNPRENTLSFARSNDARLALDNNWVMPHFSFWSWPKPFIGTIDQALAKVDEIEHETPFEKKIDKAIWRGTAWFNSIGNTALRPELLAIAKGKEWADIETLKWETNGEKANNSLRIEEFCNYKYIIYTEGITYSGRLPFHQACESIILTPPPSYLMHTTHLMKPLFSSSIPFNAEAQVRGKPSSRWPQAYTPETANIIFVDPNWLDLEATIEWLRKNPGIAKGIARRQRESVSLAGYLSPAAEACYWRALVGAWSQVVVPGEGWGDWEGAEGESDGSLRWETFSLTKKTSWV